MANLESAKTTKLYDRRDDDLTLDEVERITIYVPLRTLSGANGWLPLQPRINGAVPTLAKRRPKC